MLQHIRGWYLNGSNNLPIQLKSAVIMLRTFTVLTWAQIEAKLGIAANTYNKIYLMACDDSGTPISTTL
jgi:hypothetical protein